MAFDLGSSLSAGAGIATNIAIMIITIVVVGALLALITWLMLKNKKYKQFDCIIFEKDGFGQLTQKSTDKAGIFVDSKTKNKRLFLKRNNVGLNPDKIPYVPASNGRKLIYMLQTGLKNFHYIQFNIAYPKIDVQVGEEDVNWAINAYERQKKLFSNSVLMQLLPFITIAFISIIILVIFIYFFKEFKSLKDFAEVMKQAMQYAVQAKCGATVIGG